MIVVNDAAGTAPRRRAVAWARVLATATAVATALMLATALVLAGATRAWAAAQRPDAAPAITVMQGKVTRVLDGDSVLIRFASGEVRGVRIAGIDAPEKGQPHADVSRRALLEQLHQREVRVEVVKTDRYDRLVGRVLVANRDAGLAQLRAGLAWHFARYDADLAPAVRRRYARAERQARLQGIGLWRDPAPLPPWEYRSRARTPAKYS